MSLTAGGGVATPIIGPHVGVGFESNTPIGNDAKPSYTLSPGVGVGLPGEGHAYVSYTAVLSIISVQLK